MKGAKSKGAARVLQEDLGPLDARVGKRKAVGAKVDSSSRRQAKREKKAKKDPNKPKRPPSAFFVFLEDFRKTFKIENPTVTAVSAVGKAAGAKWKSMSPAEKAPYESRAGSLKIEYGKKMNAYNKKQESNNYDEASDKSKSEVNDEDDEASPEDEHPQEPEPKPKQKQDDEEDDDVEEEDEEEEDDDEEEEDDE